MSAHKDRLIQAAELLNMDPDDLLAKLDAPTAPAVDAHDRYRVEFALLAGDPDWQTYTWTGTPEHAASMAEEAGDGGRYRSRYVDRVTGDVVELDLPTLDADR